MRILCLDDEPLALKMLQLAVEKAKPEAEILTFSKQRELIAEAESGGCDVAFLDIHMRGMTGVEVAKTLKGINPKRYHGLQKQQRLAVQRYLIRGRGR